MKMLFNRAELSVMLMILFSVSPFSTRAELLDFNATVFNATCDINIPDEVVLNPAHASVFTQEGDTSEVRKLSVSLENCTGEGLGKRGAAIQVNGTMDQSGSMGSIFRDSNSTAEGIGIMVKDRDYNGSLSGYYNSPGTVRSGALTHLGSLEGNLSGKKLDYSVGLTRGKSGHSDSVVGKVQATLEFVFIYQ